MDMSCTVFILLAMLISKDNALSVQITTTPDYVYNDTPLNMSCKADESMVNGSATFYRETYTILGSVQYDISNCSSSTDWYYKCDPENYLLVLEYIPTFTPSYNESSFHCRFDGDNSSNTSNIITVRTAVLAVNAVLSPPQIQYNITKGQTLNTITCKAATCWPLCSFSWSGPNTYISGPDLKITNINTENDGQYQCHATNPVGTVTSSSIEVTVQYGPTNTSISPPTNQYTKIEENAFGTILCSSSCEPSCSYQWIFPNGETSNSSNLYISSLKRSHHGTFSCRVQNDIGEVTISINVIVNYGPKSTSISPPTIQYTVIEGNAIGTIMCSSSCLPICSYQWIFPNGETSNSSNLYIASFKRSHHGTFSCRVQNDIGEVTISINVIVNYIPGNIVLSPTQTAYTIIEYRSLDISCSADCRPDCAYIWSGPVTLSNKRLQITKIRRTQRGTYGCTATNSLGHIYSPSMEVIVHTLPTKVQKITLKCIDATQAVITWVPDLTVVPGQHFTLQYKPKAGELLNTSFKEAYDQQDIYVLHIDNLRPATEYIYTISSENYLGLQVSDEVSCFTAAADKTTHSPLNGALIGGIVMISIAVLLIAMVIIIVLLRRRRKSEDETDDPPKCTSFINGCLSRIPGRNRRTSNPYENTKQQSPYENLSRERGNTGENGLENTEKQRNNFYEELQTRNKSITRQNAPADNSTSTSTKIKTIELQALMLIT